MRGKRRERERESEQKTLYPRRHSAVFVDVNHRTQRRQEVNDAISVVLRGEESIVRVTSGQRSHMGFRSSLGDCVSDLERRGWR